MEFLQSKAEVTHMEEGKKSALNTADDVPDIEDGREVTTGLKLDKHGLPLSPQPTDRKDDPLVR
jgi:hypothetical protein